MKKLSIIITNYQKMPYLLYLISYFNRKWTDEIEVICINDGENPNIDYGKITPINNKSNMGIGIVRQQGLELSTGQYITYVDGDDIVVENYLEDILDFIKTGADIYQFLSVDYPFGNIDSEECMVWNKIYKRQFLIDNNCCFTNLRNGEDKDFNKLVFSKNPNIEKIDKILYMYNFISDGLAHCSCLR